MAGRRVRIRALTVLALIGLGLGWAVMARATTRQGIDFRVSTRSVPAAVKALDFLHRHIHYGLLAREITRGSRSEEGRARAVFDWTRAAVRPSPPGWPVVDDHILHIIIRGHGLEDQQADVFATLATYAGVPAFWRTVRLEEGTPGLVLSFARIDGRWTMWDVANGLVFADPGGRLMDVDRLLADPGAVEAVAGSLAPGGVPYVRYVRRLRPFRVPEMLRARAQMPLPRLAYELRSVLAPRSAP